MIKKDDKPPVPGRYCLTCKAVAKVGTPTTFWHRYPAGWLCAACNRKAEAFPPMTKVALGHGWWIVFNTETQS